MHEGFRDALLGPTATIWSQRPDLGLVLWSTWPSANQKVQEAATQLRRCAMGPSSENEFIWSPVTVFHSPCIGLPIPVNSVYVGAGSLRGHPRPSPWASPYPFAHSTLCRSAWTQH